MFFGEVVVGPTASGKTDYAVSRAREIGAMILSVDSLLVYKQLNIGTAKPPHNLLKEITHRCVNLVDIDQSFTAVDFRNRAVQAMEEAKKKDMPLIIVGGSFFYFKALFGSPSGAPKTDPDVYEKLSVRLERDGLAPLYSELQGVDPELAGKIKENDRYRVLRALAVYHQTGVPFSKFLSDSRPLPFPSWVRDVKLFSPAREELLKRVTERTFRMLNAGLVEEVGALLQSGFNPELRPLQSVGYKDVQQYLGKKIARGDLPESIIRSTMRLAKHQQTWMKRGHYNVQFGLHSFPGAQNKLLDM